MEKISRSLFLVTVTNIIYLVINFGSTFLIPKYLTITDYSYYRSFILFLSYVGLFHFGFIDGLYLKYGGKELLSLDQGLLSSEFYFFLIEQIIVTFFLLLIYIFSNFSFVFLFVIISILPMNVITFFLFIFQSTARFKDYSILMIFKSILGFIPIIILFFIVDITSVSIFIIFQIISFVLAMILGYILLFRKSSFFKVKNLFDKEKLELIFIGFFILIGNLFSTIFFTLDRLFIFFFFTSEQFAYYSFANGIMTTVLLVINSLSATFYPYFASNIENTGWFKDLKSKILILGVIGIGSYFPFEIFINWFIPKYNTSLLIIFILFISLPFIGVINAIYLNIYKAFKKERDFFIVVILMLIVNVILNAGSLFLFHNMIFTALVTTFASIIWYFYSSTYKKFLAISVKELTFIIFFLAIFIISFMLNSPWLAFFFYYIFIIILIVLYDKTIFRSIFNLLGTVKLRN